MYTVYKHTCPNGKVYIGITCCEVHERWKNGAGYKKNEHFYRAIEKYGWENIKHEILFNGLTREEAENKEKELIAQHNSNDKMYGYNCTNGGECAGKHTPETIEKIKEKIKGKSHPQTEESKEKNRQSHLGFCHSLESIERMREVKLGKKASDDTKRKMSEARAGSKNAMFGKHHTDDAIERIRQSHIGMKHTEEAKQRMSEKRKGVPTGRTGENAPNSKPVMCIETGATYSCAAEAGRILNLHANAIIQVCKGKRKTTGGYHWEYYKENE